MTARNEFTPEQERWLSALESGEYTQTVKALTRRIGSSCGYCCLGVAIDVIDPDDPALGAGEWTPIYSAEVLGISEDEVERQFGSGDADASPHVAEALHLQYTDGRFRLGFKFNGFGSLLNMNDSGKYTFSDIAAFIRKHPWAVFTNFDRPERVQA